jgi:2-C-methyl-D-erythritol 4-phosphate cytidylyltransferase
VAVWAVLVAAGRGERLGDDRPKAFARLGGRVLVAESLERLDASPWIDAIVVVAPPEWEEAVIVLAEELALGKVVSCVGGGETRAASVRAGLAEVPQEADVILVHDAARPLVTDELIERLILALGEGYDGAVPGVPVSDTIKRVRSGEVVETLDRGELVAVQTPQAFVGPVLHAAAAGEGTDCASLVEANGGRIRVVEGDPRLLKITTQADLALVESWLAPPADEAFPARDFEGPSELGG